ncbi:MAG: NAD-dependent deacylase [Flavobacteriales bacterium]|nr:NAD-dependent deacylase [Flavobacteriales bacterium]
MGRPRLVVFSGAGVSAESGLKTFRDADGLWEEYRIEDVATPDAWRRDPAKVLHFYDLRRAQVLAAQPNAAHRAIAGLERWFHVDVVTQNIDDLHERAGSSRVLHLHGEILLARSTADASVVVPINGPTLRLGDRCPLGSQLRPHIVWFGEQVPMMDRAAELVQQADILVVVGTSLQVYPAASLVHHLSRKADMHLVDPQDPPADMGRATHWKQKAVEGVPALADHLMRISGTPPRGAS